MNNNYEDINEENPNSAMIHKHQLEKLLEFSQYNGVKSGLLLNFRTEETNLQRTYYISIQNFLDMCQKINKKSVNEIDSVLSVLDLRSWEEVARKFARIKVMEKQVTEIGNLIDNRWVRL